MSSIEKLGLPVSARTCKQPKIITSILTRKACTSWKSRTLLSENLGYWENHKADLETDLSRERHSQGLLTGSWSCWRHKHLGTFKWEFRWIAEDWVWTSLRRKNFYHPQSSEVPHISNAISSRNPFGFPWWWPEKHPHGALAREASPLLKIPWVFSTKEPTLLRKTLPESYASGIRTFLPL